LNRLLPLLVLLLLTACAAPRFQPGGGPTAEPALFTDHARMADGAELALSRWAPEGKPRVVVLALHGFNDYRNGFAELGELLARRGILTYAVDQRGFGANRHRRLWAGTGRMLADARELARLIRARHPDRPFYLLGESMGGAVAMAAAARWPTMADGLVLIAPAVWGRETMNPLQWLALTALAHTLPEMVLTGEGLDITPSDNREMLIEQWENPLVIKGARVDTLWGLTNLMDRALAAAPRLTTPALLLYGARDEIIPKAPTCRMLRSLPPSAGHRLAVYPDGYHMLTRDLGAAVVREDIAAWLLDPRAPLLPREGRTSDGEGFCGE
jgi:alpha-beta hydrolase superfamily lysophospholipase